MPVAKRTTYSASKDRRASSYRSGTVARKLAATLRSRAAAPPMSTLRAASKLATANARAIARMDSTKFGPTQRQSTETTSICFDKYHPLCFHVNNPAAGGDHGPHLWRKATTANRDPDTPPVSTAVSRVRSFSIIPTGWHGYGRIGELEALANGPKCKLLKAEYQFEFKGHVSGAAIRIDFVRRKAVPKRAYTSNQAMKMYLPYNLQNFADLAGFAGNRIDTDQYQILKTVRVNHDSHSEMTAAARAADIAPGGGSTPFSRVANGPKHKVVNCTLNLNRVLKQTFPVLNQTTGDDNGNLHSDAAALASSLPNEHGMWTFPNQHPLANIWCIISTDNELDWDNATEDSLAVTVRRHMVWQDTRP